METIDNTMSTVFNNKYASALIVMFLIAYSGLAAPKLPSFIAKLFDNAIFRILILSLIVYNGNRDPKIAIMVAVGFTVTMNILSKQKLFEGFTDAMPGSDSDLELTNTEGDMMDSEPSMDGNTDDSATDNQTGQQSEGSASGDVPVPELPTEDSLTDQPSQTQPTEPSTSEM